MRPNHLFLPRFHRSNKIGTPWGAVFLESFTNSDNLSQIMPLTKVLVFHFHHNLCTSNSWLEDWELTVEVPLGIQGFLHYWRDCPSLTLPHMVNGGSLWNERGKWVKYHSQSHTRIVTALKNELLNSLHTFSSGKILLCQQTQIRFGVPVQCLCSKYNNVSPALQMAVEKFVFSRMRLWLF